MDLPAVTKLPARSPLRFQTVPTLGERRPGPRSPLTVVKPPAQRVVGTVTREEPSGICVHSIQVSVTAWCPRRYGSLKALYRVLPGTYYGTNFLKAAGSTR